MSLWQTAPGFRILRCSLGRKIIDIFFRKLEEQRNFTSEIKGALNKLVSDQPQLQELIAPLLDL